MRYLVDTNVFIEAKNRHYAFDIVPGFWDWLERAHADGNVFTIEKVANEIRPNKDSLAEWFARQEGTFIISGASADVPNLQRLATWAQGAEFTPAALNDFLSSADYYLVAQAATHGAAAVTHEVASNSLKKIKIPAAAAAMGVSCITPFDMMRQLQARLVCST